MNKPTLKTIDMNKHGVPKDFAVKEYIESRVAELKPTRTDEFHSLSDHEKLGLNQVAIAYSESVAQNELIALEIQHTIRDIENKVLDLMNSMAVAFDSKTESINLFRSWRKVLETEFMSAKATMKQLDELFSSSRINELKELAEVLKTLNDIKPNDVVKKLMG